jgi:N-glycosylase/DNA lyase
MPAASTVGLSSQQEFPVGNYDLAATLSSGQAFRWRKVGSTWEGVVDSRWVSLEGNGLCIRANVAEPVADWAWLAQYLQLDCSLDEVISSFPVDEALGQAVKECRGLRLLRQGVWECLASFILSSTKQIVQIQQIVGRLCERYGEPLAVPQDVSPQFGFPPAERLAEVSESELRKCGMGFRAPYLAETARMIARGELELNRLSALSLGEARAELMRLPGVGRKIADCVLLFAAGQPTAFPVDVWVLRILRELYFGGREVPLRKVITFTETHFGSNAGYAQQYLFHSARARAGRVSK